MHIVGISNQTIAAPKTYIGALREPLSEKDAQLINLHIIRKIREPVTIYLPVPPVNVSINECINFKPACNINERYRTYNGSCNNFAFPLRGMAGISQVRLLSRVDYCSLDGPRGCGTQLPNPTIVGAQLQTRLSLPFTEITKMVYQWGQFLNHDIMLTPNAGLNCCKNPNQRECFPFYDHFGSASDKSCINFTRSTACTVNGIRQQINTATSYIDGSVIYGNSLEQMNSLRSFNGYGQLAVGESTIFQTEFVFDAYYVNISGLNVLHTLFVQEHNRIAKQFAKATSWNDETIFMQTRRIIGAIMQSITYNEYLHIVLGKHVMREHGLPILGSCSHYDQNTDASIINEYAATSYGHYPLPEFFQMKPDVKGKIVATVIQRGRDHGLLPYNVYRKHFTIPITNEGSPPDLQDAAYKSLLDTYSGHVGNIDLFSGALSELSVDEGLSGITLQHIQAEQFKRLKIGDQYFFTHCKTGFTQRQVKVILHRKLSHIICENEKRAYIHENVFKKSSVLIPCYINNEYNPAMTMDLSPFIPVPSLIPETDEIV